jgi:hypothetical protein
MITLTQNKKLGPGDLSILLRNSSGGLIDPAIIAYSIFQLSEKVPTAGQRAYDFDLEQPNHMHTLPESDLVLMSQPKMVPARSSPGAYWVSMVVPTLWRGVYRLVCTQHDNGCPPGYHQQVCPGHYVCPGTPERHQSRP